MLWLLRSGADPDYFSPLEVAWSAHVTLSRETNARIDEHFNQLAFPNPIPARGTSSGILFTNPQPVTKLLTVDLLGSRMMIPFTLFLPVPGDIAGAKEVIHQYAATEITNYDDLDALREALEGLPCCAATADGRPGGEPLNVVLIGNPDDIAAAINRRGYRRDQSAADASQQVFGRPAGPDHPQACHRPAHRKAGSGSGARLSAIAERWCSWRRPGGRSEGDSLRSPRRPCACMPTWTRSATN